MDPTNTPQPTANPGVDTGATAGMPPVTADAGMAAAAPTSVSADASTASMMPEVNTANLPGADAAATSAADMTVPTAVPGVDPTATPAAPIVGAPVMGADGAAAGTPGAASFDTTATSGTPNLNGLPMTEPIMRPDLPPAPDPVKQELEAPMKAAAPVPGSIGSAVSVPENGAATAEGAPVVSETQTMPGTDAQFGPTAGGSTPSVSFNDPATQATPQQPNAPAAKKKMSLSFDLKNMNKGTLIALIVVAAMIVIGLAAVLIMQLM